MADYALSQKADEDLTEIYTFSYLNFGEEQAGANLLSLDECFALQAQMDKRFDALTRRIDRFMIWSFGITVTSAGFIIAVQRFWPNPT